MPRVNDLYPEEWLKAKHLMDGDQTFTIAGSDEVTWDRSGKQERQIVLLFQETELKLGLNRGNAMTLAEIFMSDDTDDWASKKVVVGVATSRTGTDYVEVRKRPTQAANRPKPVAFPKQVQAPPAKVAAKVQPVTQDEVDDGEDIPF